MENLEHTFSVEMRSKLYVKTVSISDEAQCGVLFEGNLGELVDISFVEGDVLELIGANGVLRINLTSEQLQGIKNASRLAPDSRESVKNGKKEVEL